MKTKYLIFWLCISPFLALSQTWSEPKTIFTEGLNRYPDITIDNNGVMHCVWAHKIQTNYWKIFYSKSIDNGQTWNTAEDISLNNNLWVYNPQIVADTNNILYVSYDYNTGDPNNMLILMKKFDGMQWSNPDTISTGFPGSMHSRLAVDNNNKLYCFWYNEIDGGKIYYRSLENGIWGAITKPFNNDGEMFFLEKAICDKFNNIHCLAYHQFSGELFQQIIYFNHTDLWSDYSIINQGEAWEGSDLALQNGSTPHVTWRQKTSNTIPANDGTLYSLLLNQNWTTPYLIVEDPSDQVIGIDKNNFVHIIDNEKTEYGFQQVHYKGNSLNWIGEIIGVNTTGFYDQKLLSSDTVFFLGYVETANNSDFSIRLKTFSLITGIQKQEGLFGLSISPNPLWDKTQIHFETILSANVKVKILNLKGQIVNILVDENKTPGKYSVNWEGNDLNGKEVSPGLYLVRLQVGRYVVTRSLIIGQ